MSLPDLDMLFWKTETGKRWASEVADWCVQPNCRHLIVTSGYDMGPLRKYCEKKQLSVNMLGWEPVSTPDSLNVLSMKSGNRIILLRSLICEASGGVEKNINRGLHLVKEFCQRQQYKLDYAPLGLTLRDLAILQGEIYALYPDDPWVAEIAHNAALSISRGILPCYQQMLQIFFDEYKKKPSYLPSAQQCQDKYINMLSNTPAYKIVRHWITTHKSTLEEIISYPDQHKDVWRILWSANLAGKRANQWELSPAMLILPGLYRQQIYRVTEANLINIPPIYMAWVHYCEKKFNLPEKDGNTIVMRFPRNICDALRDCRNREEDMEDIRTSSRVRELCDWLQQGGGQKSTAHHLLCREILNRLTRDGDER